MGAEAGRVPTTAETKTGLEGDKPMLVGKSELVVLSQYVNSRKKNIYGDDAYELRPERWESGELANIG
jgi:cytochrome P450